jgi:hypothetical protein
MTRLFGQTDHQCTKRNTRVSIGKGGVARAGGAPKQTIKHGLDIGRCAKAAQIARDKVSKREPLALNY